jgi:serine/threonine protein kinase
MTKEGQVKCKICHKFFARNALNRHIVNKHSGKQKQIKRGRIKKTKTPVNLTEGDLIASGTFGRVFKGIYRKEKHKIEVAIKYCDSKIDYDNEVRSIKVINGCRNCLFYYEELFDSSKSRIVMEYMPQSLQTMLDKQTAKIPFTDIQNIMRKILEGLASIHSKKLTHRDLKPDNVLIDGSDVKLCDFGWAKMNTGKSSSMHAGTPFYRPPEVSSLMKAGNYSYKIDIWAAGCILVELFTLKPTFPVQPQAEIIGIVRGWKKPPANVIKRVLHDRKDAQVAALATAGRSSVKAFFKGYGKATAKEAEDLADKLLDWDPDQRYNALQALKHHFFGI